MTVSLSVLESALTAAWARKAAMHAECGAVRLLNASASGTPRLVFELYGKHAILYDYGNIDGNIGRDAVGNANGIAWGEPLRAAASRWLRDFGWESLSLLDRASAGEATRSGSFAVAGEPPESLTIVEHGQPFRLEPRHPRNVGLFLDTRELRRELRAGSEGARVLNLFCYTGSLGLAALSGNAAEVIQVDVSARYLAWGRENLALAGLHEDRCRFVNMDAERYLDWASKKGLNFDHILLDPPVFARFHGKSGRDGKVFRFETDYFRLAAKAAALLSPGGALTAVTNYARIGPKDFGTEVARALRDAGIRASAPRRIPLPEDFDLAQDAEALPEGNAMIFEVRRD
jgi:23S rRNA (cytosine1962-C5)-methyltransferase